MPYYKRDSLAHTLFSFMSLYKNRSDFEVVIMEDHKNAADQNEHDKLFYIVKQYPSIPIRIIKQTTDFDAIVPTVMFNKLAEEATGEFLVLTNPEIFHCTDVLSGFDSAFSVNKNRYVVCACMNVRDFVYDGKTISFKQDRWYQHSVHRPRNLHYCAGISKENYLKIGGFDEAYKDGLCFDDVDFVFTIEKAGIEIVADDKLQTIHIDHERTYGLPPEEHRRRWLLNRGILQRKWNIQNMESFNW